jgi:hypothetical protein
MRDITGQGPARNSAGRQPGGRAPPPHSQRGEGAPAGADFQIFSAPARHVGRPSSSPARAPPFVGHREAPATWPPLSYHEGTPPAQPAAWRPRQKPGCPPDGARLMVTRTGPPTHIAQRRASRATGADLGRAAGETAERTAGSSQLTGSAGWSDWGYFPLPRPSRVPLRSIRHQGLRKARLMHVCCGASGSKKSTGWASAPGVATCLHLSLKLRRFRHPNKWAWS